MIEEKKRAPSNRTYVILTLFALITPAVVPLASSQDVDTDFVMFTKPAPFKRLVTDPWADGIWATTDSGAFFWSSESAGLRHVSVAEGLPTHSINDVALRPDEIWLAHYTGMSVVSRSTGQVTTVKNSDGSALDVLVRSVRIGGQYAWSAAEDNGLFRTDLTTKTAVPLGNPVNGSAWKHSVYDVWVDGDHAYISVPGYGLVHWNLRTGDAKVHKHNLLSEVPLYFRLHVTPQYVFIGSNGDGLVRYDRATDHMIEFVGPQNTNSPAIAGITQLGSELWMGTVSGITRYDMRAESWKNWQNVPGHAGVDLAVHAGNVYAATKDGDVVVYDRAADQWASAGWYQGEDRPAHNVVRGCDFDQNRLAFSTGGGGANFFDPATNKWSIAGREPNDAGSPRDILVYATSTDSKERWYAHAKGLTRHNLTTGEWTDHRTDGRHAAVSQPLFTYDVELTPSDVWAATQSNSPDAKNGGVWQPGNLARMNRATNTWTYFGPADGLSDENVSVVESDGNRIWIGTFRGVDVFDVQDNSIRHVFPAQGIVPVYAIMPKSDKVWVGAAGRFFSIDKTTLQTTEVMNLRGHFIRSLTSNGQDIWLGTDRGLLLYRPATGLVEEIARGPSTYKVYCAIVHDGILYAGTPFGVERLLLSTLTWLPQVQILGSGGEAITGGSASIKIETPPANTIVGPDSSLPVTGKAQLPAGAAVEVRFGRGAWSTADGTTTWSATVSVGSQPPGVSYVTARVRANQQTLAQTSVPVKVEWPEGTGASTVGEYTFYHEPVQEAVEGQSLSFEVVVAPDAEDLAGEITLVKDDGSRLELQLVKVDAGRIEGSLASIAAGSWSYTITVTAGVQTVTLPAAGDDFGETYQLMARAAGASVTLGGTLKTVAIAADRPTTFKVPVTNALPHAADMYLTAGGEAGSWVGPLPTVKLVPNQVAQLIDVTVTPPRGKTSGTAEVILRGTVDGFPSAQPSVKLVLAIGESAQQGDATILAEPGNEGQQRGASPGLAPVFVLALAALVVLAIRRRENV